ncbi:hypothetical protein BACI71_270002 [Bacillus mycoides]|uniref:Uncharacterized protein n=1 Tax=Bacillus mycoides TaxID=1405 RepID=A0A653W1H9_BACMY|nr:hypothetical protein BACI71_270002 [Bacillus mycoides]
MRGLLEAGPQFEDLGHELWGGHLEPDHVAGLPHLPLLVGEFPLADVLGRVSGGGVDRAERGHGVTCVELVDGVAGGLLHDVRAAGGLTLEGHRHHAAALEASSPILSGRNPLQEPVSVSVTTIGALVPRVVFHSSICAWSTSSRITSVYSMPAESRARSVALHMPQNPDLV